MGASAECHQETEPGSCQLEVERHLIQVLLGDTWPELARLWRLETPKVIQERGLGPLSWWAPARAVTHSHFPPALWGGDGTPHSALISSLGPGL